MKQQQQPPGAGDALSGAGGLNLILLAVDGYAACFWPFMRCRFGVERPGTAGLAAIGVMWMVAAFAPCPELVFFFAAWLVLVLYHRIEALTRGRDRHSRYDGWPWLAMLLLPKSAGELMAKSGMEAVLLFVAGALLTSWSKPLGGFVMLGGVPQIARALLHQALSDARMRKMRNTNLDMQSYYENYKQRYSNRR